MIPQSSSPWLFSSHDKIRPEAEAGPGSKGFASRFLRRTEFPSLILCFGGLWFQQPNPPWATSPGD